MVQKFKLTGDYEGQVHHNQGGKFDGDINLDDDFSFNGGIVDRGSRNIHQTVEGHLRLEDGLTKIWFVKRPLKDKDANLVFYLQKKLDDSFEGKYSGQWSALFARVEYSKDYGVFIARVDPAMCGIRNTANVCLEKSL